MRSSIKFREHREEFFGKHVSAYHETVTLALELGEEKEAFEYAERAKGRIFLEMLEDTRVRGNIPDELAEREQKLKEEIGYLREMIRTDDGRGVGMSFSVTYTRSTSESSGETEIADVSDQHAQTELSDQPSKEEIAERLKSKKKEHDEVLKEIRKKDLEAYTLKTVDVASLDEIQETLSSDEQVVEYTVTEDEILVFLLEEEELDYRGIPMEDVGLSGDDALWDAIAEYRDLIEPPGRGDVSQMKDLGQELYQILIKPVEEKLGDNLIVVPHGPLHLLPFSALYDGENYLIENHMMRFVANASSLRFLDKENETREQEALVVGDPRGDLEHAREEAREVAEIHNTEPLLGKEATLEKIDEEIEGANISHFCCHGHYDPESPRHSCLLLAQQEDEDERGAEEMQLEDVFNLDVGSELVTLSACETAYGNITLGDEVTSLTRGFQYAGSPNVIGTLWKVDDESTRRFFESFYESEGDKAERLRETQIEFIRESDEYSHPFYWSAFQMYGTG